MNNDSSHHYVVVVAGGSGTRLWPLSREELPKQMQKVVNDSTLIENTIDRIATVVDYDHIFVSTTKNYGDKIAQLLPKLPSENIIVEPVKRGTTAAFAYFSETICQRDPEAVIFSMASDHSVPDPEPFRQTMHDSFLQVAQSPESIALVGVVPNQPDTGLGYIKVDKKISQQPEIYSVEKFIEKPSLSVAQKYVDSGEYYWNAAYYCFRASTLIKAYEEADPDIMKYVRLFRQTGEASDFMNVPEKSHEIDIINAQRFPLVLVPGSFSWSDIGNWGSLYDLLAEGSDGKKTVSNGARHLDIDSENCLVMAKDNKKLVATVGLDNIVVVDTEDALLIMDKTRNQDVKAVIEMIKQRGLNEYL